jgi:ectoine hydroxylase-related dioxygenase (phytanoyl-CoA dioxygenase family)
MMSNLSKAQISQYSDQGYLLYKEKLFSKEKLDKLTNIFEEHLAQKGEKLSDELDTPHFWDERLLDFLLADEVLDVVQGLIGPNIGLWSSHFISKAPKVGRRTPWHEDSAYWNGRFDDMSKLVTVWLAIDDSTLENGCMGVVPGSHSNGFSEYETVDGKTNVFESEIKKGSVDESKVVWFELNRGECSLHDSRIIHGANANTSDKRRCGYTMRYFSLGMKLNLDHPNNKTHKIWHARGENIANNPLIYRS